MVGEHVWCEMYEAKLQSEIDHFRSELADALQCASVEAGLRREAQAELAASEASCDRLRSSYDDIRALNVQITINCATERAAKDAEIAELRAGIKKQAFSLGEAWTKQGTFLARAGAAEARIAELEAELAAARKWNQDLLDAARETRPDDDRRAAEWGPAVFADLKEERAANAANIAYAKDIGKELAEVKAVLEAANARSDAEMERVKACEHIADGDEGWEKVRDLCPSTAAVARLQDRMEKAVAQRDALQALLTDKTYIQCKADYNRGHLSHANYLNEREHAALQSFNITNQKFSDFGNVK